jgi:mono/diheme cytochrome c family protein
MMNPVMTRRLAAFTIALTTFANLSSLRAEPIDFSKQILPIFAAKCAGCHGADKQLGKLRLDAADQIEAFHEDTLLVAGKPEESELFQRITLPADDKKRMPKESDPLPAEEIELIRQWISEGATFTVATTPAGDAPAAEAPPEEKWVPGEEDPALAELPAASPEAIAAIEAAGGTVMPLFGGSPLLQVSFAQATTPPGDAAVAALSAAADQIVWLNLSKANVTAGGLAPLANLKNLIRLHLENSNLDDAGLAHVASLKRLEYLNVYGTTVTDASIAPLKELPRLRDLYVWKTQVSFDAAEALKAAVPGLDVNLGWDHPQVVRIRVTKELEVAKKMAEEAGTKATEMEAQFNAAKEAKTQADARVTELENQLKALDAPPAEQSAAN